MNLPNQDAQIKKVPCRHEMPARQNFKDKELSTHSYQADLAIFLVLYMGYLAQLFPLC